MREIWLDPLRPSRPPSPATVAPPSEIMTSRPLVPRATPAPARRGRAGAPERYYVGRRPERTEVYVVSRAELEPLAHLSYQGDAASDWGCLTDGALELAFAMLVHSTRAGRRTSSAKRSAARWWPPWTVPASCSATAIWRCGC